LAAQSDVVYPKITHNGTGEVRGHFRLVAQLVGDSLVGPVVHGVAVVAHDVWERQVLFAEKPTQLSVAPGGVGLGGFFEFPNGPTVGQR
jgi:hypothetical protein